MVEPLARLLVAAISVFHPLLFTCSLLLSCRCYIMLYDSPPKSSIEEDDEMAKLPASQKKKIRQKQRKAVARTKKVLQFISCTSGSSILLFVYCVF